MKIHTMAAALAALALTIITACSTGQSRPSFAERLAEADSALSEGDCARAQTLADELLRSAMGHDSTTIDDTQAASLGILFMELAERQNEDENVADATQCIRRALRLSDDSLKSFFASLPLEDTPRYVLLRRIGISIDNPMELPVEEPDAIEPDSIP